MMSLLALILVATPVCQLKGTNWEPGEVVNAPDGKPLFELKVSSERATVRLTRESMEIELENRVARLTGRLPVDATLSVAPSKPIELNAVMRMEPGFAFGRTSRGVVLPEELRRPDGSAWKPIAVACAQLELALGEADVEAIIRAARLLKATPHGEEGVIFPGAKSVTEHQPLNLAASPGGPIVVKVMPLLPTPATVMAKRGAHTRLRFIVGGVRIDGWIKNREDAFAGLALPDTDPPSLMLDGRSEVNTIATCQREVPLSVARADGTVVPAGTLKQGASLSRKKPSAQWVEIASDELYAWPAAGGTWVLALADAEGCPEVR